MGDLIRLVELDQDPNRGYTAARADLPRLVRKLRHRGFANVRVERAEATVHVRGHHRMSRKDVELTLQPARAGSRDAREWAVTVRDPDGRGSLVTDLAVRSRRKRRFRYLDEIDPPALVAAATARLAQRRY